MKYYVLSMVLFITLFGGCAKSDDTQYANTEDIVKIDHNAYGTAKTNYTINSAKIIGNTLEVTLSSSGCDGDTWKATLIDAGAVMESNPVQRAIRIDLKNEETCQANITKKYSFDITKLRVDGVREVSFILDNWRGGLLYKY